MAKGRYNLVVYLGSGTEGRRRRERLEREARANGYVNKRGGARLAPYVVALLEGKVQSSSNQTDKTKTDR